MILQKASRRGGVDYVITNPKIASYLNESKYFVKDSMQSGRIAPIYQDGQLKFQNGIKILVNPYQTEDYILMGYSGNKDFGLLLSIMKTVNAFQVVEPDFSHKLSTMIRLGFGELGNNIKELYRLEYIKI